MWEAPRLLAGLSCGRLYAKYTAETLSQPWTRGHAEIRDLLTNKNGLDPAEAFAGDVGRYFVRAVELAEGDVVAPKLEGERDAAAAAVDREDGIASAV